MKKARLLAAFFAVTAGVGLLSAAAFNQYKSTRFNDVQADNIRVQTVSFGDSAVDANITLPSSSASVYAHMVPVYNPTGSSIALGTPLISSTTGAGYINSAAATTDLTTIVGVAGYAIAGTSRGWMIPRGGGYAVVRTTGTVTIGMNLVSTTSAAGYLTGTSAPTTGADVATAMTTGTAAGGTVLAIMH